MSRLTAPRQPTTVFSLQLFSIYLYFIFRFIEERVGGVV